MEDQAMLDRATSGPRTSLLKQLTVPFKDTKLGETFCTPDDGEMYQLTKRGAKSLDNYGDIVGIEPDEKVRLDYSATLHRHRVAETVAMLQRLTSAGFMFYSSVLTEADPYKDILFHTPAVSAWSDRMYFHMPGRTLLLTVELAYEMLMNGGGERLAWRFDLSLKGLPYEDQEKEATRLGVPVKVMGEFDDSVPLIPAYRAELVVPGFNRTAQSSWFEGRQRCMQMGYLQIGRGLVDTDYVAQSIMNSVNQVLPFTAYGQFGELSVGEFAPLFDFPNCNNSFWMQFNTSYLCKVVRRPIGMGRTSYKQ